jgi:hypothetical protein
VREVFRADGPGIISHVVRTGTRFDAVLLTRLMSWMSRASASSTFL